ncbi:hypothetical protein D3C78_1523190 [compost metagenome]
MGRQEVSYSLNDFFNISTIGFINNPNMEVYPSIVPQCNVFKHPVNHCPIRNNNSCFIRTNQPGTPKTYLFNRSLYAINLYYIANSKGFIQKYRKRAD